jgi:hypothetical protein
LLQLPVQLFVKFPLYALLRCLFLLRHYATRLDRSGLSTRLWPHESATGFAAIPEGLFR